MYRSLFVKKIISLSALSILGLIVTAGVFLVTPRTNTEALNASDFNAGRIIDDAVFYNKDAMNVGQIQTFLDTLVPNCDTWGTAKSGYGNLTNSQYAQQVQGWPAPPYVCINKYFENPNTGETSYEKGGGSFDGGISAAQIIYNAAQQYGVNPQVLLVTLKKESQGPLTSDSWPLKSQYKYSMGYGCPDSGPGYSAACDSTLAGFYKQVMKAAWQFKYYKDHINDYRYKLGWNKIQYSTDPNCGTKDVYIENIATLSLYIYTPYTPNDAAVANYPGTATCGSYGNRNFFMYFKEWFGTPNYRPPSCDSQLADVRCVWRLYNPTNVTDFLTTSDQERDSAVVNNKFSYENTSFYAYTSQKPGSIPVYRLKLPDRYFYTASEDEKNALIKDSKNIFEGIAFYALPPDATTNASYQVYRLHGDRGNILTLSTIERDNLIANGYTYEGIAFNTPSPNAVATAPSINHNDIYRLSNGKIHFYTASLIERDTLLRSNWSYEGILSETPVQANNKPVYRLFDGNEHFYTTSLPERDSLVKNSWKYEGIAWYVDNTTPNTYRFYTNGEHFYTTDINEAAKISNIGASYEGIAFGSNQGTTVPIYRLYNGSEHFFTANTDEVLAIANLGWKYEGIAWQTATSGNPVYRLMGPYHFYTGSVAEKDALIKSGWKYEGIAWQTDAQSPKVYRLNGPYHFYTTNIVEKDELVKNGWKYEGIAW